MESQTDEGLGESPPELGAEVHMRWRKSTGSLVFYSRGSRARGVKACEDTEKLRTMVEELYARSVEVPREEF